MGSRCLGLERLTMYNNITIERFTSGKISIPWNHVSHDWTIFNAIRIIDMQLKFVITKQTNTLRVEINMKEKERYSKFFPCYGSLARKNIQ